MHSHSTSIGSCLPLLYKLSALQELIFGIHTQLLKQRQPKNGPHKGDP